MAPIVRECRRHSGLDPALCVTAQHRQMLDQVLEDFGIEADEDLDLMQPHQTLAGLTSRALAEIDAVLARRAPDCVVAQGDTTTVLATALAAFYRGIPFVHVEAGLRTGDLNAPWPEEMNRRVASLVTALHCAPTRQAADNLLREGIDPGRVHVTGNTVIDALYWTLGRERAHSERWRRKYDMLGDRRMVLITGHRRENFGEGFLQICLAIAELGGQFPEVVFLYPVHLNPNVQGPVRSILTGHSNIHLVEPAPYSEFVWLMDRATLILTDSGGIQEEAPSLRKPLLVMRDTTERPEAVESGAVELVGTSRDRIVERARLLLTDEAEYARRQIDRNPYGDGHAAERIVGLIAAGAFRR